MADTVVDQHMETEDAPRPKQPFGINQGDADRDDIRKLFVCSQMSAELTVPWFHSFEGLALLDLYNYQDELAKLNGQVYNKDGTLSNQIGPELCQQIRTKLRDYYQAIEAFRNVMHYKPLEEKAWTEMADDMNNRMGPDRNYERGVWVDVRPEAHSDVIWNVLRKALPSSAFTYLDLYTEKLLTFVKTAESSAGVIESADQPNWPELAAQYRNGPLLGGAIIRNGAAIIDQIARPIIALTGGLFLLVP